MRSDHDSSYLWRRYPAYLQELIESQKARRICDIGGGRNPALDETYRSKQQLEYTLLDISQHELDLAPDNCRKLCVDIGAREVSLPADSFDFCFSKMVAEHIRDGEQFHRNIFTVLRPGGLAVHFFPTLYTLPFLVNRLVPETLSSALLNLFAPRDRSKFEKFPAYYSYTYGPTDKQLRFYESLGYEVDLAAAGFGHNYYRKLPLIRNLAGFFFRFFQKRRCYLLTSYSLIVLRKPGGEEIAPLPKL